MLKYFQIYIDNWNAIIVYHVEKLNCESRKQWELSLKTKELPPFAELPEILHQRSQTVNVKKTKQEMQDIRPPDKGTTVAYYASADSICVKWETQYPLHKCNEFGRCLFMIGIPS